MTKAAKGDKSAKDEEIETICRNRRATFDYEISDRIECGVVLVGTEVKSLREGHASLDEAYAKIDDGEVWLLGAEIPEYLYGNRLNHKPKRPRKLLMHRREIAKFAEKASERGFTLIPLRMYFKKGRAKLELAVARGKKLYDKRQDQKKTEARKEIHKAMKDRNR